MVLPVATDEHARKPPGAAAGIKALEYDAAAEGPNGRLANRVGGLLGLRVQGRDSKVFISYPAVDGTTIAKQLHDHLISLGHRAYLDQAKEFDGEPNIRPGSPVQKQIDEALEKANLVLLIDTPSAPSSEWIKHEVDTADGLLLPILPLCFRWVAFQTPDPAADQPLSDNQIDKIVRHER